jgi:hypothetical protein
MCGGRALTLELSQLRDRTVPKLSTLPPSSESFFCCELVVDVIPGQSCGPSPIKEFFFFFVYFQTLLSVHCFANDVHRLANIHCLSNVHAIVSPITSNRTLSIPPFSPGQRPRARTQCPSRKRVEW